ncbi:hypothetical protein H8S90_10650 [Olivibacter sp. SDN3]|uniref:DUF6268 family outer membrane beta-barrel protein n=1 Tax=Olivibacter sp. SDN3 TaxID=2764720 RepID=UPI0016517B91|nr:DUF6268 family outer membrane beta-barrel protein [Olivibacter sp. SDN3]QNL51987.1 hypothetical protein H8S90_10650 [Olivibacter sp. SDN3]
MEKNWKKTNYLEALFAVMIIVCGQCSSLLAQVKLTGVNVSTTYIPGSRYIRPAGNESPLAKTTESRSGLGLTFSLSNKTDSLTRTFRSWSASFNGNYRNLDHKHYSQPILPDRLVNLDFALQHVRSLNNGWSMLALLSAGIYSDMEKVNSKDVFLNGGAAFIKTYSRQFSLGFGGFVNTSFGTPMLWPAIIVQWQTGNKFRLNVDMPTDKDPGAAVAYRIAYAYTWNKQNEISLLFRPRLALHDTEVQGDMKRMLTTWEFPLGIENRWRINKVDLIAGAGVMMLREYRFGEKKLSKMFTNSPGHRLASNYFVNLGMAWNF